MCDWESCKLIVGLSTYHLNNQNLTSFFVVKFTTLSFTQIQQKTILCTGLYLRNVLAILTDKIVSVLSYLD